MKKAFIILFVTFMTICGSTIFAAEESVPMGQTMPDAVYTLSDGETFDTAQVLKEKKAIMILFFSSDCPACMDEIPLLNELVKEYGDQAAFLALDSTRYEAIKDMKELWDQNHIDIPLAREEERTLSDMIPYEGYPCNIVLDKNSNLVFYQDYKLLTADDLKEVFDTILAEDYEGGFELLRDYQVFLADNPDAEVKDQPGYSIVVKDQNGDPVSGVMINFCSDAQQTCRMDDTDEKGEVFFEVPEDIYHITILAGPDAYSYDPDFEMITEDHYGDPISITINKN